MAIFTHSSLLSAFRSNLRYSCTDSVWIVLVFMFFAVIFGRTHGILRGIRIPDPFQPILAHFGLFELLHPVWLMRRLLDAIKLPSNSLKCRTNFILAQLCMLHVLNLCMDFIQSCRTTTPIMLAVVASRIGCCSSCYSLLLFAQVGNAVTHCCCYRLLFDVVAIVIVVIADFQVERRVWTKLVLNAEKTFLNLLVGAILAFASSRAGLFIEKWAWMWFALLIEFSIICISAS